MRMNRIGYNQHHVENFPEEILNLSTKSPPLVTEEETKYITEVEK